MEELEEMDEIFLRTREEGGANAEEGDKKKEGETNRLNIYALDIDITETMETLKSKAGQALQQDLSTHCVMVLSEKQLEDKETLQDQCGTQEGVVQVQFTVRGSQQSPPQQRVLDIMDVLKPNDAGEATDDGEADKDVVTEEEGREEVKDSRMTRWIVCPVFKEMQKKLKIPQDPREWTTSHVHQWLRWAINQFGLQDLNPSDPAWDLPGRDLFTLTQKQFRGLVPNDPGDVFYMHFELLRRTCVVAVVCDPSSSLPRPAPPKLNSSPLAALSAKNCSASIPSPSVASSSSVTKDSSVGWQQIQLWQFLLELLTEPKLQQVISWQGSEGEFCLHQPEIVAGLWGQRKSKPNMNYEKLSRALRYYYDGEMMAKVSGKRFVYRFVLDLHTVLGYDASQLRQQVEQCCHRDDALSPAEVAVGVSSSSSSSSSSSLHFLIPPDA